MKKYTLDELKTFDGREGRPVHVAVEGKVYDLSQSELWKTGRHMDTHDAGADLSKDILDSPHGPSILEHFTIVGELMGPATAVPEEPGLARSGWFQKLLDLHPHPMSVHFPIALTLTAALLLGIALVFFQDTIDRIALETVAFVNIVIAAFAAPVSAAAGLLSHRFNYAGKWTPVFRKKRILSIALVLLLPVAVIVRQVLPEPADFWIFGILVFICAGISGALGYLGGTITFPRNRSGT